MEFECTHQLTGTLEVSTLLHAGGEVKAKFRIVPTPEKDADLFFREYDSSEADNLDIDGWEKPRRSPQLDSLSKRLLDDLEALRARKRFRKPPPPF